MTATTYVIIGNGVAGITAAQEIRRVDQTGHIRLISDEGTPYYYRASMSEWLSGELDDVSIIGRTDAFYADMRIESLAGHVAQVDANAHTVRLDDGQAVPYDKLLIATGAQANRFPVEGLDEIVVFRDFADVQQIKERMGCCGRALILGGGILGLELAGALHKMGIGNIAVVQRSGFVGSPLLDAPSAAWLQAQMQADGVELFLSNTVERVVGQTAHFTSGKTWDFDIFVQAVGIHPVFPDVPGLTVGRGVQIDDHATTNLPDVYAAGDCTETYDAALDRWMTTRIWLDGARQGKVAACNMTDRDARLSEFPFFNASLIYTAMYAYVGEPHGEEGNAYIWEQPAGDHNIPGYRKVRVVDGKLAGALLLGQRHGTTALYHAIGQPVAEFGDAIVRPDFPWNELTGQDWDYVFF